MIKNHDHAQKSSRSAMSINIIYSYQNTKMKLSLIPLQVYLHVLCDSVPHLFMYEQCFGHCYTSCLVLKLHTEDTGLFLHCGTSFCKCGVVTVRSLTFFFLAVSDVLPRYFWRSSLIIFCLAFLLFNGNMCYIFQIYIYDLFVIFWYEM